MKPDRRKSIHEAAVHTAYNGKIKRACRRLTQQRAHSTGIDSYSRLHFRC